MPIYGQRKDNTRASGGAVLNKDNKVIGIIKAGVVSYEEKEDVGKHGFVPIHIALKHWMSQQENQKINTEG